MLNVYDYAYQILYDATIECCNKLARFEFSELINFLITDNTKIERVFENYSEISIDHKYLKKIMMLIITSCAYLVCEYKTALEINDDEVTEVLTMLENLKPQEIITLFHQKDSDLNKIYEYYQEYANGTYIYRFDCWQNLFYEGKIKTVLKLNPFVTLNFDDIFVSTIFPKTESTIQLLYTFYEQALYKAEMNPEYNEEDNNSLDNLVVEHFHDLSSKYFNNNLSQIYSFYSMIIGVVYENIAIIKDEKYKRTFRPLLKELENTPSEDLISTFYNNPKFALQIIDLFIEFNDFLEEGNLVDRRIKFLKLNKNAKLKKFNPYFDEEELTLKKIREKSAKN